MNKVRKRCSRFTKNTSFLECAVEGQEPEATREGKKNNKRKDGMTKCFRFVLLLSAILLYMTVL